MGVEIAISIAREETRVAVLDNGVVTDLYGDRAKDQDFVGNIYKGRVAKVLPGMQAAFIDIGLEKAAFMHVSDLSTDVEPGDTLVEGDDDDNKDSEVPKPKRQSSKPIEELLSEGQEVMVQISKGSDRYEGITRDDLCVVAGSIPGVHADGRAYRRIPSDSS